MSYDSWYCSNSNYWNFVILIGELLLLAGVLFLALIWLFYALRKKVKFIKKINFIPGLLVFALFTAGTSLLFAKNVFGYLLIVAAMLLWTIYDKNIFPLVISFMSLGFKAISSDRIVGALLNILFFISLVSFMVVPIVKGKSKKEIFKILLPIIFSLILVIVGIGLLCYVGSVTSSLGYCWGVD